jgi:protein-S-isoprenylcysteine O-methyltransferase Ste14
VHNLPVAARLVLLVSALIWLAFEARQSANDRPDADTAAKGSPLLLVGVGVAGFVAAGVASALTPAAAMRPAEVVGWLAVALLWCGIALRLWSFRTLGRYFTFTVQTSGDQPVISDGPYRVLRHPSYTGLLLGALALGLQFTNWLALACVAASVLWALGARIKVEERALLQTLGEPYADYAADRKRLLPFLW